MTFKSKIDAWIVAVLIAGLLLGLLGPLVPLVMGGKTARPSGTALPLLISLGVVVPVGLLVAWMFTTTRYVITATDLLVQCGPMKVTVPLASIREIDATRSVISAPALSLDRLAVRYGKYGTVVISPKDKQGFVRTMVKRVPGLVVSGVDMDTDRLP